MIWLKPSNSAADEARRPRPSADEGQHLRARLAAAGRQVGPGPHPPESVEAVEHRPGEERRHRLDGGAGLGEARAAASTAARSRGSTGRPKPASSSRPIRSPATSVEVAQASSW
jgi:hypothetical protein